jgi:hypothetical protein
MKTRLLCQEAQDRCLTHRKRGMDVIFLQYSRRACAMLATPRAMQRCHREIDMETALDRRANCSYRLREVWGSITDTLLAGAGDDKDDSDRWPSASSLRPWHRRPAVHRLKR